MAYKFNPFTQTLDIVTGIGSAIPSGSAGSLLYVDLSGNLAQLDDVATGNALISGGVGAAPSYGKIGLTTHVSGTLPVANGGTAVTALSDVLGTTNQVSVSGGTARVIGGNVTLSLPQNIHTGASPTFANLTISSYLYQGSSTLLQTFGTNNTFFGLSAGNLTLTGYQNTSLGLATLANLTLGYGNTATGYGTMFRTTEGANNAAYGDESLFNNTDGSANMAMGTGALASNTHGNRNCAVGGQAIYSNLVGEDLVGIGFNSLFSTLASGSIGIGKQAGITNTTGTYNVLIGYNADVGSVNLTNAIAIGANSVVNASNAFVLGGTGSNSVQVGINTTAPTGQFDVIINSSTRIGQIIQGAASQSVDLQEWQDSSSNILAKVTSKGNISEAIGSTTSLMTEVGVANIQTASSGVGNTADTADDTLFTYSLPSNSMSANGKSIRVIASGHFATTINTKRVKLWFAGTAIADSGAVTLSNVDWRVEMEVTRIDSTHVSCVGTFMGSNVAQIITVTANLSVSDLTANASVIKVTGSSTVTGAANDVLGYFMRTDFAN